MDTSKKSNVLSIGLALFSMFFGAGNIVFPLLLGQFAGDKNLYAVMGLLITAIVVPFTGLVSMLLFDGNYKAFFGRLGKIPAYSLILIILSLIGPVVCSRLIAVSYATLTPYLHGFPFAIFSVIFCGVVFLCTIRKQAIIGLLGYVLTPLLLLSIFGIIGIGLIAPPPATVSSLTEGGVFLHGLIVGYNTLDLVAALAFATMILVHFKRKGHQPEEDSPRKGLIKQLLLSSLIAAALLSVIYVGLSLIAASYHTTLEGQKAPEELLGALARQILGASGGLVASIAVVLACLTTAISSVFVFAEFLQENAFKSGSSNKLPLLITLVLSFCLSMLGFAGIMNLIGPLLEICYPGLMVLSVVNIAHKLYGFKPVKTPVFIAFTISFAAFFFRL